MAVPRHLVHDTPVAIAYASARAIIVLWGSGEPREGGPVMEAFLAVLVFFVVMFALAKAAGAESFFVGE